MRAKALLLTFSLSLLLTSMVWGQAHTVRGRVISGEDRAPMLAVNVVVKHTNRGAATDNDGRYEIPNVSPQDTLVFLFIGYRREEIPVGSREVIDVVMTPQAIAGEELVVTGYGTQQRRDVTSAIASLGGHAFTQGSIRDMQQLMQARVPGVVVSQANGDLGAATLIRIRGGTSISASNDPLIVIDGVPVDNVSATPDFDPNGPFGGTGNDNPAGGLRDNPLGMLNPSDIASIDILKDASAAAIYGARGGNGVILITTKEGRAGGFSVTYDGYTSTASVAKKLDLLDAATYRSFAQQVGASFENIQDFNTDWQDAVFRTALSHNHSLSFSSGTANTSYLVSLNYLDEEGVVLNSDRRRISGRLNLSHKALDGRLRLAVRLNPSFVKRNNVPYRQTGGFRGGLFTNVLKYNPTLPVHNADGSFYAFPNPDIRNPVAMAELIDDKSETSRILANSTLELDILSNLTGKINLGLDRSDGSRGIYQPRALPYAAAFGGRADIRENERQNVLFESTFHYRGRFGDSQRLEAWAGYTWQEFQTRTFGAAAQNFVTDAWSFNNLSGGADFSVRPFSFASENRLISFLGRVNYALKDKYLISAALRYEGSSRFGEGNKWGTFPSVSVGWRLSEEAFLKSSRLFDDLKLRFSFGITGNQDIGDYKSLVILGPGSNAVIGDEVRTGVSQVQLANPDLKWEETKQINLGADFSLWDNRVSGSIDVYQKTTTNLLLEFDVPQPAVVPTRLDNAGEVQNKGIELSLSTINYASSDFFWRTDFNFASNKNEVTDLGEREFIITGRVSGAGLSGVQAQIIREGFPLGTFFGPRFLGYDENGNEILSTDPNRPESKQGPLGDGRFILGDAQPDFTFGISSTMTYKNLDFRFYIQGVQGFDLLNNTRLEYQRPSNVFNGINLFRGAIDDVNNGLAPQATVAYTDRFIEDGSFIRLQNVTLGYTFHGGWVQAARLRNLRLYVSADNLFVITDYTGYDPEVNTFAGEGGPPSLGIDYTNYPRARVFTFGINLGL